MIAISDIGINIGGSFLPVWPALAPSNLALEVLSDTSMRATWTNNDTTGDGTKLYISTDNITFTLTATNALGVATKDIEGLTAGSLYYVKIRAYKGSNYSEYSSVASTLTILSGKFLFWGKVSEIAGGQMPNKVGADALTVGGTAGTYTFQCPDTAPYIAADTDYIWFKTDETLRTPTEAELVGYDFPRTLVKYDNTTSYAIREIIILADGETLTTTEENSLRDYMQLSIWWSNVSSDHGVTKGNRSGEQSHWTAESVTDADSDAFIARMGTAPSAPLAALIDKTFKDLKTAGIYNSLVQFTKANIHNETDAKLNWIDNTLPIVPMGNPVFTAKQGWALSTNKYLKSGFIPSVQITAGIIGADDAGILLDKYLSAGDLGATEQNGSFAASDNTKRFQFINYSASHKKCYGFLNDNATGSITLNNDVASADGIFYVERNSNVSKGYYEKVQSSEIVMSATSAPDQELYFGALLNELGTNFFYSNETLRTIVVCKYLGATKQALLYDIIKYFNDNVGGTF